MQLEKGIYRKCLGMRTISMKTWYITILNRLSSSVILSQRV